MTKTKTLTLAEAMRLGAARTTPARGEFTDMKSSACAMTCIYIGLACA